MNHSPSEIFVKFLKDSGLFTLSETPAWPLYISSLPDGQGVDDEIGSVTDTTGVKDGRLMTGSTIYHPGIQLRVRSRDYSDGFQKASAVTDLTDTVKNASVVIGSDTYVLKNVSRTSDVIPLGVQDDDRRFLFSVNFIVTLKMVV